VPSGLNCSGCSTSITVKRRVYQYTCPKCGLLVHWSEKDAMTFRKEQGRGCLYGLVVLLVSPLLIGPISRHFSRGRGGWLTEMLIGVFLFLFLKWALTELYAQYWK
jgi:predicted RNA-binding Zn-ribbon protein involved in translation (DUF1610 family)